MSEVTISKEEQMFSKCAVPQEASQANNMYASDCVIYVH